jgi:hypothetical protein
MIEIRTSEGLPKKYSSSPDECVRCSTTLAIQEKKRNLQTERLELLARYGAMTVEELKRKIREGGASEPSAWEDLIEIKNIEAEMREIDNGIRTLPHA